MQTSSGIQGKVVAITGASSGIGEATALLLAEQGAKVVLGARGSDRLKALAARIADGGGDASYAVTDVRRRNDVSALVKLACERYGKLDVFVNNAGIGPIAPLDDLRVKEWEDMIDVNIKGVLYGIAAALPVFRRQGFGHFVNTASTAGLITKPNQAVYSATKFAVKRMNSRVNLPSAGVRGASSTVVGCASWRGVSTGCTAGVDCTGPGQQNAVCVGLLGGAEMVFY